MNDIGNVVHIDPRKPPLPLWATGTDVQLNEKKALRSNHHNVMIALRHAPEIRDVFAYDEMLRSVVVTHAIGQLTTLDRRINDNDTFLLLEWLQQNGLPNIGPETVRNALYARAMECPFHPVLRWLRSLIWDGQERLGQWLTLYLGAEMNDYTAHIGRMFLTSMVARIKEPGCQVDYMMVLEGPQGRLKSSACRVLGGEWFSDHLPDVADRFISQHLRDKWLIEVSEMHAMGKAETALLKSFITRKTEQYRPPYGRAEVFEPRQCVFVGTTNQEVYFKDQTGARRFWPVKTGVTGPIELGLLEEYREQLFAEAVYNYMHHGQWWPDAQFETEVIVPEQAARQDDDIWREAIEQYLVTNSPGEITVYKLAKEVLGLSDGLMRPDHGMRIGGVLRRLGWKPHRTAKRRWWTPPQDAT